MGVSLTFSHCTSSITLDSYVKSKVYLPENDDKHPLHSELLLLNVAAALLGSCGHLSQVEEEIGSGRLHVAPSCFSSLCLLTPFKLLQLVFFSFFSASTLVHSSIKEL